MKLLSLYLKDSVRYYGNKGDKNNLGYRLWVVGYRL
jgi:hypothetical protein